MKVELFKGQDGWRWRKVAANGEIVSGSEAYASKRNARRAAQAEAQREGLEVVEVEP